MDTIIYNNPTYNEYPVSEFIGNPLIESLAPIPTNDEEAANRMLVRPEYSQAELEFPAKMRMFLPSRLRSYMFPSTIQTQILMDTYIQVLDGYKNRNPLSSIGQQKLHNINHDAISKKIIKNHPSTISFITGLSGMGKSRTIESVMNALGATVVIHNTYKGEPFTECQIVCLKRNVPDTCTTNAFCKKYGEFADELLGTDLYSDYFRGRSLDRQDYVKELNRIIKTHHVGALVIDELQNLYLARSGGKKELIALIVNLEDEIGVPIILVGTYKAVNLLAGNASTARRLIEGGYYELKRPTCPDDEDWLIFAKNMWDYQWLKDKKPFSDKVADTLFDCSQGITSIMLNLFIMAQRLALDLEYEYVTAEMIRVVYDVKFKPFHSIINALRSNDERFLDRYDDLYVKAEKEMGNYQDNSRLLEILAQMQKKQGK